MSRLDEMEINETPGASVDELREKAGSISCDEDVREGEHYEDSELEEEELVSPLAIEFMEINPLLNISTAEKMVEADITEGQVEELSNEAAPRRGRIKFICMRIKGLTPREIADILGMKHSNGIRANVKTLNKEYAEEGFYYELATRRQKKAPTKKETEEYEQRLASL